MRNNLDRVRGTNDMGNIARWMGILILFVGMAATGRGNAADRQGNFVVFGVGSSSCATFLLEHDNPAGPGRGQAYRIWIGGYLSAMNREASSIKNVLAGSDLEGALGWLRNFCRANPLVTYGDASHRLLEAVR